MRIRQGWRGPDREILELISVVNTVYIVLLFVLSVLCIIQISRKSCSYKALPSSAHGTVSALPAAAITLSLCSIITFFTIAQRGYIHWSSNYRFIKTVRPIYYSYIYGVYSDLTGKFSNPGQYGFCMFVLGAMASGIILLLISMIYMTVRKKIRQNLFSFIFSLLLIFISSGCIYRMIEEMEKFHRIGR